MAVVSRVATLNVHLTGGDRALTVTAAVQDTAAGGSVVLTFANAPSGVTPLRQADTVTIKCHIDNANLGGTSPIISFALTAGEISAGATRTFVFTSTGAAGGSNRVGTVRLRIEAAATAGTNGVDNWSANTDANPADVLPATHSITQRDQGWIRGTTTATVKVTKTNFTDAAFTGTYAYPDQAVGRVTLGARAYDLAKTVTVRIPGVVNQDVAVAAGGGDTNYDATFTNPTVTRANFGAGVTSRIATVPTMQASGLTGADFTVLTITTQTLTINPDLTFAALTRTSPLAVVNYALHTVTGTFNLRNARSENISTAITLNSLDLVGSVAEGAISAALTGPTYSPSWSYTGPASTGSRGTGPNNDTAGHTQAGKTKGLRAAPNNDPTNTADSTATFVALSDLLRLDVHPQKGATLVKDTDPYANPGAGESPVLQIAVDVMHLFGFVGDVNGAAVGGVNMTSQLFDPDGGNAQGPFNRSSTASGTNKGWASSEFFNFAAVAPAGQWKARVVVELTAAGALGNYGDAIAGSTDPPVGGLNQFVSFSSPYSADKWIDVDGPNELYVGQAVTFVVRYAQSNADGTITHRTFDATPAPKARIYGVDSATGDEEDLLASVNLTGPLTPTTPAPSGFPIIPTGVYYTFVWTATLPKDPTGAAIIRVIGTFAGGNVILDYPVKVKPRFAVKVGPLADRF